MNNNKLAFVCFALLIATTGSCSHKQMYESLQIKQKNDCQKVPPSEYDQCMEKAEKSYEQYEKERQELKK